MGTNIKKKWKILIAATGSVASLKVIELVRKIRDKAEVKVVLTESVIWKINRQKNLLMSTNLQI